MVQARADLAIAERDGDLVRAGELTHAVLPRLEKELQQVLPEGGRLRGKLYGKREGVEEQVLASEAGGEGRGQGCGIGVAFDQRVV